MDTELKDAIESQFNHALTLRDKGDYLGAIEIFERLNEEHPDRLVILGMWAIIYFHLRDWKNALPLYRRAVSLSPKSESASLGLFHSLWNSDKQIEAVAEMRRFLSGSKSIEYDELLKDMDEELEAYSE